MPTLESENERLRSMLGLGGKLQWGFVPAEALQGRGRDRGLHHHAERRLQAQASASDSLVVAPEGVVGMVQTVDPTMSLAILFAHPDFRVSAMSADGSAFGIVQPHLAGSGTPPQSSYLQSERWLLELRGVPFRSTLKPGAVVYSSGLGGIYPRGIPVGVVLGEIKTPEAWARTYLLRPAVNPAEISVGDGADARSAPTSGLTNVWADIAAVDSATRGSRSRATRWRGRRPRRRRRLVAPRLDSIARATGGASASARTRRGAAADSVSPDHPGRAGDPARASRCASSDAPERDTAAARRSHGPSVPTPLGATRHAGARP